MDSRKIVRIILGLVTLLYSILGLWYFYQILDYYGLFIAVGLLLIGILMTFSGIIHKYPQIDPEEEPAVDEKTESAE